MRNFVTIDAAAFPVVIVKYHNFIPNQEEFVKMQTDIEQFIQSHRDFLMIVDLSDMPFLPSEYRIAQGRWSSKMDPIYVKQNLKIAFSTPSLIGQLMLKGVLMISKPRVPHTVTSSVSKAIEWGNPARKH